MAHAELRGFRTFHHSAATIVNQKTGNLKLVQKLLGHTNLSTTADVYTHTSADADRRAALALEQAIFGDLFQVVPRFGPWNNPSMSEIALQQLTTNGAPFVV